MSYGPVRSQKCARSEWVTSGKEDSLTFGKVCRQMIPRLQTHLFRLLTTSSFSVCVSGRDGLQQRGAAVPPAGDREQRGRGVLRRGHGQTEWEEEEEEEEGASYPDHRLSHSGHFWLILYKRPLPPAVYTVFVCHEILVGCNAVLFINTLHFPNKLRLTFSPSASGFCGRLSKQINPPLQREKCTHSSSLCSCRAL